MSEKHDIAMYLANLLAIQQAKEDNAQPFGQTLAWEYARAYDQLREILGKEKDDETRQSNLQRPSGAASTADQQGGFAWGSGPLGPSDGRTHGR